MQITNHVHALRILDKLAALPEVKVLLSAWDEPRREKEAGRIFAEGQQYLQRIHEMVHKVAGEEPEPEGREERTGQDPMQLCRSVLVLLGLPPVMANPLVAASFQASLRTRGKRHGP
jgi:hydroxyacylglutathione hydrolase